MSSRCVTVVVHGQEIIRTLIVDEDQLCSPDLYLHQVRCMLLDQGVIDTGAEAYSFLSSCGSTISQKQENLLTLKDICTPHILTDNAHSSDEDKIDNVQVSIMPVHQQNNDGRKQQENESTNESQREHTGRNNDRPPRFNCPFRDLKDVINIHDHVDAKTMFKVFIALIVAIVCTLFMAMCTFQVAVSTFGALDLARPVGEPAVSGEAIMGLKVKLQEVEFQSSYRVRELEKRLQELEDMYLKDLKLHAQEMAKLKASLSGMPEPAQSTWQEDMEMDRGEPVTVEKTSRPNVDMVSPEL